MSGAAVRGFAGGFGAGSVVVYWRYRHYIMNPDDAVASLSKKLEAAAAEMRRMQERERQARSDMRKAVLVHGQKQKAQSKEDLRKAGDRLRQALHKYKQAVESRQARKVAKAGVKVLMNIFTFGAAEGVSAMVDVAEMALDVADAVCDGSTIGVATALLDGVVDIADYSGFFKGINAGFGRNADFGELVVDLIDVGEECAIDVDDCNKGLGKIHKVQENLIRIEQSMLQGAVREEGTELLRAVADLLVLLEHLNVVSSAEATFYKLLERHLSA